MATLANLPEDVMIVILSMLPAESLLRFKSVCKFWYALINDPKFIRKHLSHSTQHEHVLIKRGVALECPNPQNTEQMENIFSILSFDRFESSFEVHLPMDENYVQMCGHSHGLVCFSDMFTIFICNPTTREFRELPPSIHLLTEDPGVDSLEPHTVGFGYDIKSKDFKVVRVVDLYGPDRFWSGVEIYDLSKDRWREIEIPVCGYVSLPPYFQMYSKGIHYWWAYNYGFEKILTFDMSEEVFESILVPEEVKEQHHNKRSFGVLNGSIFIISYDLDKLDLWKMNKDESRRVSWSKLFTINDLVIEIMQPLLLVSSDELLVETKHGRVILYNMKTQHFIQLPIKGHPLKFQATFFIKSLISVKEGTNGF